MSSGNRVFVSSTCYDLIDVRAELEYFLRELGFAPILSDRPLSDFAVLGEKDSIEICLTNVRSSDIFICILSQRYGAKLGKCGFDDVSATHLEVREARRLGMKTFVYVRDRLVAEHSLWVRNGRPPGFALQWVKEIELFELFDECKNLAAGSDISNWYTAFRDSVDLKQIITTDLRGFSGRTTLRRMLEAGRLPRFELGYSSSSEIVLTIRNIGKETAFDVVCNLDGKNPQDLGNLISLNQNTYKYAEPEHTEGRRIFLRYSIESGDTLLNRVA